MNEDFLPPTLQARGWKRSAPPDFPYRAEYDCPPYPSPWRLFVYLTEHGYEVFLNYASNGIRTYRGLHHPNKVVAQQWLLDAVEQIEQQMQVTA